MYCQIGPSQQGQNRDEFRKVKQKTIFCSVSSISSIQFQSCLYYYDSFFPNFFKEYVCKFFNCHLILLIQLVSPKYQDKRPDPLLSPVEGIVMP